MDKILYISDLDGTLLDSTGTLSDYSIAMLNDLIRHGIYFTFATARTIYSAKPITDGLNINVPCILNNGASIYDMESGKYIKNNYIQIETARKLLSAFRDNNVNCFVFKFIDDILVTCYDRITSETMQRFVDDRKKHHKKPFRECEDLANEIDEKVIYINATGDYETLLPVKNAVDEIDGADCAFYRDTYTDDWFLETFSSEASKANGIKFLREHYGFDKIFAFGDNLNDLSMFREADVKIAVGNARVELRENADVVIDTNDNNGVADWIYRETHNKMSYKNVYGSVEYERYISKYRYMFDFDNLTDKEIIELPEGFLLKKYIYDDRVEYCVLFENSHRIFEYESYYSHTCSLEQIIHHSNGYRYFPFHIDLYGISLLEIETGETYHYIPEGYTHLHHAPMGESFIITEAHYDKESDLIAYGGCYWACPYDVFVGDFSNPIGFNPHLLNLHYIFDPDYDLYDDIIFKEWKDGRLYVICGKDTEKSISVDELKELLRKQV